MKFCQEHWDTLRVKIHDAGLSSLVPDSGEKAAAYMASQLEEGPTIDNYDPLMSAHWAIAGNAMEVLKDVGAPPFLLYDMPEFPNAENECPICCLNLLSYEHDLKCTDPNCQKSEGLTFDNWLDKAVEGQVEYWKELGGQ